VAVFVLQGPDMTQGGRNRHSFILRIWQEGENQEWKGWMQYANNGETSPLRTLADVLVFIERHTGELFPHTWEGQTQTDPIRKSNLS
jgi:hypothetical protein